MNNRDQENRRRRYSKAMWNVAARYNQESKQINGSETVVKRTGKRRYSQLVGLS